MLEKVPGSIGESLKNRRAGMEATVFHRLERPDMPRLEVFSAFENGGRIPVPYTADGVGYSPPLKWRGVPPTTASIVLIVEDADSPTPHPLVHAIVVNMGVDDAELAEGAINSPDHEGFALQVGRNSFLRQAWLPPDPPPGHGDHRYVFQIYALHSGEAFSEIPGRHEIFEAIKERAAAGGVLIGTYGRDQKVATRTKQDELEVTPGADALGDAVPA